MASIGYDVDNKPIGIDDNWRFRWTKGYTNTELVTYESIPCLELINSMSDISEAEKSAMLVEVMDYNF